jgi:hypothetical protein
VGAELGAELGVLEGLGALGSGVYVLPRGELSTDGLSDGAASAVAATSLAATAALSMSTLPRRSVTDCSSVAASASLAVVSVGTVDSTEIGAVAAGTVLTAFATAAAPAPVSTVAVMTAMEERLFQFMVDPSFDDATQVLRRTPPSSAGREGHGK